MEASRYLAERLKAMPDAHARHWRSRACPSQGLFWACPDARSAHPSCPRPPSWGYVDDERCASRMRPATRDLVQAMDARACPGHCPGFRSGRRWCLLVGTCIQLHRIRLWRYNDGASTPMRRLNALITKSPSLDLRATCRSCPYVRAPTWRRIQTAGSVVPSVQPPPAWEKTHLNPQPVDHWRASNSPNGPPTKRLHRE